MNITTESLLEAHSDICKILSTGRVDVEQTIRYYKSFLTNMLEHERAIRRAACHEDKDIPMTTYGINFDLTDGLCYNLGMIGRVLPLDIRIHMRKYINVLMADWSEGTGYSAYPVPSFNASNAETMFEFSINRPQYMWGEGPYADARWNLVRYLAGAL